MKITKQFLMSAALTMVLCGVCKTSFAQEPLRWVATPSNSGASFETLQEAINDYKSNGGAYEYVTEEASKQLTDDFLLIAYKVPDSEPFIGDWVYGISSRPCSGDSIDTVLDCHVENMREELAAASTFESCPPYYEVNRQSGEWYGSTQNAIAKAMGLYKSEGRAYEITIYGVQQDQSCGVHFNGTGGLFASRVRDIECQYPTLRFNSETNNCYNPATASVRGYPKYFLAPKGKICSLPLEGNPCSPATGTKTEHEVDFVLQGKGLSVERYYSSLNIGDGFGLLGNQWRHNYATQIDGFGAPAYSSYHGIKTSLYTTPSEACVSGWGEIKDTIYNGLLSQGVAQYRNRICEVRIGTQVVGKFLIHNTLHGRKDNSIHTIANSSGYTNDFAYKYGVWKPLFPASMSLERDGETWIYKDSSGKKDIYSAVGVLLSRRDNYGRVTAFSYDDEGRLNTVTGPFGHTLIYHYESDRLTSITTPEGDLGYGYDEIGRLTRVTYVDGSERHYHYEDSRFPYNLTGITDENNERFATWAYDDQGRAILSEHADGTERVEFAYNADGTTTVTSANGALRTYYFTVQQGQMKVDHIDGDRCATCANGGTQSYTYDNNGFVESRTDWNGNRTTYTRDEQGRELSRTEGAGTPEARTTNTTWDTDLNKPLSITEPDRIIEYHYSPEGRLLSREERSGS